MKFALAFALLLIAPAAEARCLIKAQKPMVEAELFFGRDIPGGGKVSDADWAGFVDGVVADAFPDGFTVDDAQGAWRDAKTRTAVREDSKVVIVEGDGTKAFAAKLVHVADAYKKRFRQDAVGIVTRPICAAF